MSQVEQISGTRSITIKDDSVRETDGPLKIEPDTITIVLLNKEPDPITIVLLNKEPDQIII